MVASTVCCFCKFAGGERAVLAHLRRRHAGLLAPRGAGRAKGPICHLCGYRHDNIERPGWARRRKVYERGSRAQTLGEVDTRRRHFKFSPIRVPPRAKKISEVSFIHTPCPGPYLGQPDPQGRRFCTRCNRPHHEVPRVGDRYYMVLGGSGMASGEVAFPLVFGEGGTFRAEPPVLLSEAPWLRDKLERLRGSSASPG